MNPEHIIASTGAEPISSLPVEGLDKSVQAWDVIKGDVKLPENSNIAIIGGGIVGCEVMEMLVEKGNKVSIIERLPSIAPAMESINLGDLYNTIAAHNVNIFVNATAKQISNENIQFEMNEKIETLNTDMVILAVGQKSVGMELIKALKQEGFNVHVTGDANRPRKFIDATREAFFAAVDL